MAIHILVFPFPAQGHMLPLLNLAHRLALHPELTLTVVVTPKNLPSLSPLLSAHPSSIQTLTFPFPPHPKLPLGAENVRDVGNAGNIPIIASLHCLCDPIIKWFRSHPNPPVAVLSDFFLGWTVDLATDLGIPRIAFFSSGAFLTSVSNHCWNNLETVRSLDVVPFSDLPGSPAFKEEHLPSVFRYYRESDSDWAIVRAGMLANTSSSWGCVFNSFDCLEGEYLDHLRQKVGHGRVYGVGPLCLTGITSKATNVHRIDPENDVLGWLNGLPDRSVVYVCFGSQKVMTQEQLDALAVALEKSEAHFIWIVNECTAAGRRDSTSIIREEFENRVAGRGKVIRGWVQQVEILNHRAVGCFLSHCGWNSVQEAIVAGVVILGWPMEADQYVNARLLVDDMGVAVRVCEGPNTVPDPYELSRAIARSVREGTDEMAKAKELREKVLAAVLPGGRSSSEFDRLMTDLVSLTQSQISRI